MHYYANTRVDEDPSARNVWPKKVETMIGAGGTHGELCVRFSSEDIREPIIKDNLLDDDILNEHMEKNRFEEWFMAACRTGKKAYDVYKRGLMTASQQQAQPVDVDGDFEQVDAEDEATVEDVEVIEVTTEQDHDVEMQEA
jgi:nuclear pore complex protein Nup133